MSLSPAHRLRLAHRSSSTFSSNHHNARPQDDSWFLQVYRHMVRMVRVASLGVRGRDVLILTCRNCRNKVLPNKEDGYAVKAILAHDAITHPDHPLRIAGKPGIELFIGELATYCATQRPITLFFQVPWKMAKRAFCSPLRKSNTSATGCTPWASQKSLFRSHILTVFSRRRGYKITRP